MIPFKPNFKYFDRHGDHLLQKEKRKETKMNDKSRHKKLGVLVLLALGIEQSFAGMVHYFDYLQSS